MTRGRPPRQAIREAGAIAEKLGAVVEVPCSSGFPADFMILCTHVTFFVRVKRTRSHISDIREIVARYKKDLLSLCTIRLTDVVFRELWVRSPRGSWQYFRILEDGIVEIRTSGNFDRTTWDRGPAWSPDPDSGSGQETVFSQGQPGSWDPKKDKVLPDVPCLPTRFLML
jgi:hypothetical protein